jgi:6-phosphogluconolactonase
MDGCGSRLQLHNKRSKYILVCQPRSACTRSGCEDIRVNRPISRRSFVKVAALSSVAAQAWWAEAKTAAAQDSRLLFVGTETGPSSKGIYAFHWDPNSGELKELGLAAESNNPTFLALAPDGEHLYAANELDAYQGAKSGAVSGFTIDRAAAKLTPINVVPATGAGTCHLTLDHSGRTLICANYTGGSAASFHVDAAGRLSEAVSQFHYQGHGPDAQRQEASHAHRATVSPDNRFVYVNDLGLDCIHIYHLDAATAKLTPNVPPQWSSAPGAGPRALRFHPSGKWAYCVTEMASTVDVLAWDSKSGALATVQTINLLPAGFHGEASGCEIVIDRSGRFAYAAERTYDHIVAFHIDPATGKLSPLGDTSCGGKIPRHIALDPTERWLLVANQVSDNIAVFSRNAQTGELAKTGSSFPLVKPQCLLFA